MEHDMGINTRKIIVGGLAAGLVLNILDFIMNGVVFADRMKVEANAFKAGLGDSMAVMDPKTIAGFVIMDFVIGMLLAYTYAAMRPRFGAGAKTSIIGALILWLFACIVTSNYMIMGMMSRGLWMTYALGYLVSLIITSLVAGALYSEDTTVTARA
jgi:hypothetical protein